MTLVPDQPSIDKDTSRPADEVLAIMESRCRSRYLGDNPPLKCTKHEWFAHENIKILDVDMKVNSATIYHRKIYTFDSEDNIYMKFGEISSEVKSLDELVLLDTSHACMLRLVCKCYIVIGEGENEDVACTFGALSNRYIDKNSLDEYDIGSHVASEYELTPIAATLKRKNTLDTHGDYFKVRVQRRWSDFTDQMHQNFARQHLTQGKEEKF